jgi:hypothetical protein
MVPLRRRGSKKIRIMQDNREITAYVNSHPVYRNFIDNLPYNIKLKTRARALRKAGVLSEVIFWMQVQKRHILEN